jgi:hypothetical protein
VTSVEKLESVIWQADDELSKTEKVGVALYIAVQKAEEGKIAPSTLKALIEASEVAVEGGSVYGLVGYLEEEDFASRGEEGYGLTIEGRKRFGPIVSKGAAVEPREESFIVISEPDDSFYGPLINDINTCYKNRVYDATLILTRKLLENLLIEILRGHYGMTELSLFYIEEKGRFQSFSTLLKNAKDRVEQLRMYDLDIADLLEEIDQFREEGNASAHSITVDVTEQEIDDLSEVATKLTKRFLRIREQVEVASS